MKIIGKQLVEIDVEDQDVYESFLCLLKRKLPSSLAGYNDVFVRNDEIFVVEEYIGHNRDIYVLKLNDIKPKIEISDQDYKLIKLYSAVREFSFK